MKILQVCKKFPFPIKDGESMAVMSLSKSISSKGCMISLLAMNTSKHFVDIPVDEESLKHYSSIETVYIDNKINYWKAFFNIFSNKSYNVERFDNDSFHSKLIELIKDNNFDIIQLESLYMAPYVASIEKNSSAKIVMRSHNLEYQIWNNLSKHSTNPLLKWYFGICGERLKSYELEMVDKFDLIMPISKTDFEIYRHFINSEKLFLLPVGIDSSEYNIRSKQSKPSKIIKLGYIGSLDWKPNIEGLLWFFNKIWKKISSQYENVEFHLAGRNPIEIVKSIQAKNLIYHGEVEDAKDFLANLDIVIVPLLSGSGIRVKILESMAMGKVVFSTSKGFEGINFTNFENAFLFDDFLAFKNGFTQCMSNSGLIENVGNNAREFIKDHFDSNVLKDRLIDRYKELLS